MKKGIKEIAKEFEKQIKKLEKKRDEKTLGRLFKYLYFYATHDTLTGLWNRQMLNEILGKEVAKAIRHKKKLSVIMLDIDDFKKYNDTYGHLQGDEALRTIIRVIVKNTRKEDFVSRYCGEEFIIVLPEANASKAREVAERIKKAINETKIKAISKNLPKGYERVTVSMGIAEFKDNINNMLKQADRALFKAKALGKNKIVLSK